MPADSVPPNILEYQHTSVASENNDVAQYSEGTVGDWWGMVGLDGNTIVQVERLYRMNSAHL